MTFEQVCEIEPKVRKLLEVAQKVIDDQTQPVFCARDVWFSYCRYTGDSLRVRLDRLVGYHAANRQLNKPDLYEMCEASIIAAMPPCRGCKCATIHREPPKGRRSFIQPRFPQSKYCRLEDIEAVCSKCGQHLPDHAKKTKSEKAAA